MPLPSRFFSSPVVAGERIYLTSEDGDTHVIRSGPRFEILATNSVDEPVMASPRYRGRHDLPPERRTPLRHRRPGRRERRALIHPACLVGTPPAWAS